MAAYYNEINPYAAQWIRNLIDAGHIAPGIVDERSIEDVKPSDLDGFTQCHFFAGIAVWSHALRQAGWPDDRPVWTGSAPCQPFSIAGKGKGTADERHLWPAFHHLIKECKPVVVFGEQVEAAIKHGWLDLVQDDLEGIGYTCGAVGIPAAGVGAPHIRQRLYWVANTELHGHPATQNGRGASAQQSQRWVLQPEGTRHADRLAGTNDKGLEGRREPGRECATELSLGQDSMACGMADSAVHGHVTTQRPQHVRHLEQQQGREKKQSQRIESTSTCCSKSGGLERSSASPTNGFWRDADWLLCRDGKWRPVEPGTSPLANGATARVGRLRAYGNAIVSPVAQAFVKAYMEIQQ